MNVVSTLTREFKAWGKVATRKVKAGTKKYGVVCGKNANHVWTREPDKGTGVG